MYIEKELKKELVQIKNFLLSLIASLPAGVIVVDSNGIIIAMNERVFELLGITGRSTEYIDKSIFSLIDREKFSEIYEKINSSVSDNHSESNSKNFYISSTAIKKDNGDFYFSSIGKSISSGLLLFFEDVTYIKQREVVESQFISTASHQLRTPISTIKWYTELLLDGDAGPVTPKQKAFLQEIENGSERMSQLVNALLNLARIEGGTFSAGSESVDVAAIIDSTLKDLLAKPSDKSVDVKKEYANKKVSPLKGDASIIQIITQNLIDNALKYTPDGGRVVVDLKESENELTLIVKDTGLGIPRGQQNQVFSRLFRADNARDQVTDGTGLGLHTIKRILDTLGGKIWFESEENEGSTFYVSWPLSGMREHGGSKPLT